MTRLILFGAAGRMGKEVEASAAKADDLKIVARVDVSGADGCLTSLDEVTTDADAIVDFSHHAATATLTEYAVKKNIPLLIATTGQSDEELALIRGAAAKIPVFFAANYSLGIAALIRAAKAIVALYPDADIEIIEKHHNRKLDAPSGTALSIARAIASVREGETAFLYGRGGQIKRQKNEIGIHAVRLGNIVGEHEVLIGTDNETISLKHEAHSRALFADGALAAARFLVGRAPGLYSMTDLVGD
ncbi:MAG: 4-hydroxy-tetrahydrodipicolinate reductase [Clostridia bacterium]|nr:4-hydroxy-tetrahydrodipicolinate reductase [Clostridia bacterium]